MKSAWPNVALGRVLEERREIPPPEHILGGLIPIVSKIRFNDGKIQLRTDAETKTNMILVRPGDLVVSGINAAKGAIAIYGENEPGPIAATIHYGAYAPRKDRVDVRYLWWLLRSHLFRDILLRYVPGGIKTELKAKRLLPIPIPLPPLREQHQIVARLDVFAAKIEEARSIHQRATEGSETTLQSVLRHWLGCISADGILGSVLSSPPRNGWSARCDNADGGTPVLSLAAVTGFRYRPSEFKRTSLPAASNAHFWLSLGDLLLTRSNTPELVGHAAIYDGRPFPCIYPDLMMRLITKDKEVDRRFVWWWLRSPVARDFISSNAKGTSPTMKKISQETVMNIPLPVSLPLPDQRRIVSKLDTIDAKVDCLKAYQIEMTAELDALLPSILSKAFNEEL